VAAPSPPGPPTAGEGVLGIMTWNVYFGNNKFDAMGDMLRRFNPDIANLQETNNKLDRIAEASDYVSANTWKQSHDWCGYNFHRSDWEHHWAAEIDVPGSRGVCGAMVQRNETKLCVWGLHPVQNRNNVRFSKEAIRLAAEKMKECSSEHGAASIFMGDFNTMDWRGAMGQLEESTGWQWALAAKNHIDFIFVQTSPMAVGRVVHSEVVGYGCVPGFPGHNTRTASCGWSDHNPVYTQIQLR